MANTNKNTRRTRSKADKKPSTHIIRIVKDGRPLSLDFFRNHAWLILISVVVVLALIGQRYSNQSKMVQIKRLEKELAKSKSNQVARKAEYMSLIRENEMRRLLRTHNLDLDYQEQPPFTINQ